MAGDAFGHDLPCRAVTGDAICFCRHKNIRGVAALRRMMTVVAFHAGVLGVIEVRLRKPPIDENRVSDKRRYVGYGLHLMAERAAVK